MGRSHSCCRIDVCLGFNFLLISPFLFGLFLFSFYFNFVLSEFLALLWDLHPCWTSKYFPVFLQWKEFCSVKLNLFLLNTNIFAITLWGPLLMQRKIVEGFAKMLQQKQWWAAIYFLCKFCKTQCVDQERYVQAVCFLTEKLNVMELESAELGLQQRNKKSENGLTSCFFFFYASQRSVIARISITTH